MAEAPQCPVCKGSLVPLSDHDRQALSLATDSPLVCPQCHDSPQMSLVWDAKANERSNYLALIQSFRKIETAKTLQEHCEGLRAALATDSKVRYALAEVAPELFPVLWGVMEKIGGAAPPRPAVVYSKPRNNENYIQNVLDAIGDVVRWCEAKQAASAKSDNPGQLTPEAIAAAANKGEGIGGKGKKPKNRKKQSDPKEDKRVADAYVAGGYRTEAACATALGVAVNEVHKSRDRHRKRQAAKERARKKPRQ